MAQLVVEMSSDEAKLLRGMQKLVEQQKKMEQGYSKVRNKAQAAGTAGESMGNRWQRGISSTIQTLTGGVGLVAAIGMVTQAFQHAKAEADKAIASFDKLDDTRRRIVQISGHDVAAPDADFALAAYGRSVGKIPCGSLQIGCNVHC